MTSQWVPRLDESITTKYKAIASAIIKAIDNGELQAGDKLPTHRALADKLDVTVGTVTRAYAEAEKSQRLESRVGSGTYVKEPAQSDFGRFDQHGNETFDLSYSVALNIGQNKQLGQTLAQLHSETELLHYLLAYHEVSGTEYHQEAAKAWMTMTGIELQPSDRVLFSNGGQHGFYAATLALCQRGDTVLAAGLTYPGFSAAARQLGLKAVALEFDETGVTEESFSLACSRYQPKVFYVCTRLNNPSCEVMSAARIDAIAAIARQYQVTIVEDDVQGCLQAPELPTFKNSHPDITVFVSSVSKALAGGLRVGFILPPLHQFEMIAAAIKASCWMAAPLSVEVVSRWILNGEAQAMLRLQQNSLRHRHAIASRVFDGFDFKSVATALNFWLIMPPHRRALEVKDCLAKKHIVVQSASAFAIGHYAAPQAIRICLGGNISQQSLEKVLLTIRDEVADHGEIVDFSH